ncbi:unnamed protein product [Angiostrongylus costaricensis]|uniref:DUF771 domain-containing protein n=1 Tax=Angiostrongylus costaricensis TaxID=334426 RepID=A0A0R3PJB7_ANGCS|nr:unnamed protein product [Angiostrongylus costaricensis]
MSVPYHAIEWRDSKPRPALTIEKRRCSKRQTVEGNVDRTRNTYERMEPNEPNRWTRAVSDRLFDSFGFLDFVDSFGCQVYCWRRPPTHWSEFFVKLLEERYDAQRVSKARRAHWATLAVDQAEVEDLLAVGRVIRQSVGR